MVCYDPQSHFFKSVYFLTISYYDPYHDAAPLANILYLQAQTIQQRQANEKYARREENKRGKPETHSSRVKKQVEKSPIPKVYVYILLFLLLGGIVFELARLVFMGW